MIKIKTQSITRVCQGDIISDVEHVERVNVNGDRVNLSLIVYPLVIVLTQDCDLEQDFSVRWARKEGVDDDKLMCSILLAPLFNYEHLRTGEHLKELGRTTQKINSEKGKNIKTNQTARYHYLEFPDEVPIVPSVIDFKHYFSADVEYLKEIKPKQFVCKVAELYREDISHRFAGFLSRIGLPEPG
jgi:hypothetical protein